MLPGATPEEELAIKRALEWRRKNPVGSPGWQQAASQPAPAYQGAELPPTNPAQPPVYQNQPLAAAQPQGVSKVDETEDTEVPAGALDFANMTPEAFSTGLNDVLRQASALAPVMSQKDYEAAKQKIMERRFGPSRAEQLFALSAALAKPTYAGNRFGQILGNVAPALADTERMRREADTARESALEALKQQYMTGTNAAERQKIEALLSVYKTAAPVVAAKMKPQNPWSGATFVPGVGWVPRPDSGAAPVAINKGVIPAGKYKGRPTTQYSDGSFTVTDVAGNIIHFDAKGNRTNG